MPISPPTDRQLAPALRDHQTGRAWRQRQTGQREAMRFRSSAAWQKARASVLNEAPVCPDPYGLHVGRIVLASEVDHVIPLTQRPDLALARTNLQGLCTRCHRRKTQDERAGTISAGPRWVIAGPPGAGKSTYVRAHQQPGDMLLDFDRMLRSLTGEAWDASRVWSADMDALSPFAWAAYDGVIERLRTTPFDGAVWVIGTLAETARRRELTTKLGARCLVLATPAEVCLAQIAQDPRREAHQSREFWTAFVRQWWERFALQAGEQLIV
jgi:5-methylcytosine-specific restriction protein A